uniref:Terpene synthase N-terminal domain-containing protein n=1 Tax=Arundo donax TaxID=35708 RepID=A0A0A9CFA3_ARUDO
MAFCLPLTLPEWQKVNCYYVNKQRSEEWMRERADQLKGEVQRMFELGNDMSAGDTVRLVDTLEHLGIDKHFLKEIDAALSRIHGEELEYGSSDDLHMVALRFCLLRQHGFWVQVTS